MKLAILDDYNRVALKLADWSAVQARCQVDVIDRPLQVPDEAARVLAPYHILCHLRERMPMPRALIEKLPSLKLMTIAAAQHRTLDMDAATERGIIVSNSIDRPGGAQGTPELAFGLMLAAVRRIAFEDRQIRQGRWQSTMGFALAGKTLGVIGLGRIGRRVTEIARAFRMNVIAWSRNMTAESATAAGATQVDKDELFRQSDIVSVHVVLGERSRGLIGAHELALMKPTAYLINTARGPIVDEAALVAALQSGRIAGAGLDVYDREPLGPDHPLFALDNVVLTPHLGYVIEESFRAYYEDTVENVLAFLDGKPLRVKNPEVLG